MPGIGHILHEKQKMLLRCGDQITAKVKPQKKSNARGDN